MLRMQEGEGQTRLCLDRLQLEAIHKVGTLLLIFPSFLSSPPNSELVSREIGEEKVTSSRARQTLPSWSSHPDSHPIIVLFFQIAALLFALTARTHPEVPTLSIAFVFCSFHRYVSVQTWTLTDGWSLEGSRGWFGSILSVDSPVHWATVCSLKAEPISVLCSSWPPPLQGLAFLQPAIAFCPVPSHGPRRTLGMKSAENNWLRAHSHRNWGLPGQ